MVKKLPIILIAVLLAALLLGGCADKGGQNVSEAVSQEESGDMESMPDEVSEIEEEELEPFPPLEAFDIDLETAKGMLVPDETGIIPVANRKELAAVAVVVNAGDADFIGKTFVMQNDINLGGYDFVPIGGGKSEDGTVSEFNAVFDGQGFLISGLTIRDNGFDAGTGLFGVIGAEGSAKNVHIMNASVAGKNKTGGVAGWNKGSMYNCSYRGEVTSAYKAVGGIAGQNGEPDSEPLDTQGIEASFCNAQVNGAENAGTFAGESYAKIINCYALGSVAAIAGEEIDEPRQIGGFIGENGGTVECCFSSTEVYTKVAARIVGGFIGYNGKDIRACYYNQTATSNWKGVCVDDAELPINLTGCTVEDLLDHTTYEGWDFITVWIIDGEKNRGLPYLQTAGL